MENFQSDLYGRTGTVQVKSGMSIDSHLERCLLVQTAELYSPNSMFPGLYILPFGPKDTFQDGNQWTYQT